MYMSIATPEPGKSAHDGRRYNLGKNGRKKSVIQKLILSVTIMQNTKKKDHMYRCV